MNRKRLLEALKKQGLSTKIINYIILTHMHADHCLLAGLFENAVIIDNDSLYSWDSKIQEHEGKITGTDIKLIETPCHDQFHCSVLVETDKESLLNKKDSYMKNEKQLKADYIIPGHGKMFKVEK